MGQAARGMMYCGGFGHQAAAFVKLSEKYPKKMCRTHNTLVVSVHSFHVHDTLRGGKCRQDAGHPIQGVSD